MTRIENRAEPFLREPRLFGSASGASVTKAHRRVRSLALALCGLMAAAACGAPDSEASGPHDGVAHDASVYALVPIPAQIEPGAGWFVIGPETRVILPPNAPPELRAVADRWADRVRRASAFPLLVVEASGDRVPEHDVIRLELDPEAAEGAESAKPSERYHLSVGADAIRILAPSPAGLFYGLQTLRQLLPPAVEDAGIGPVDAWRIPAVEIEDAPRFGYRGLHLDVGRHFFPVEFIKRYLDLMALFKLNTFHWHLTEDQGWRLEIEAYPRLTGVGACRAETMVEKNFSPYVGDGTPYCGFYTQEEAREIVEYARERFIAVIPEIEMPGHSLAALAAYPEFACTSGPFEVATRWGVFDDIFCPSEETFDFLEDVLTEVMEIFPSEFIHIGGDEAPKTRWRESPLAQEVIRREGLGDEDELQSYFIRRIERFLNAHGRRLIGWDEILEGGLAPNATVMSWRGTAGGIEAARQGHDVVMTPVSHLYFDYYQGDPELEPLAFGGNTTLRRVYKYEPIPDELTAAQAQHVLGAQGNVWTEYMRTSEHVEYMAFPRALALAEVVWSPRDSRDWSSFSTRLGPQLERLSALGVRYRVPDVEGLMPEMLTLGDSATIELRSPFPDGQIRYTLDGTEPSSDSPRYDGPLTVPVPDSQPVPVRTRIVAPDGRLGPITRAEVSRARLHPAAEVPAAELEPGLQVEYFEGEFGSVEELRGLPALRSAGTAQIGFQGDERPEYFGLRFSGSLRVPESGVYHFSLASDDGSRLHVGDRLVVDHDGPHGMTARSGAIALEEGYHPFELLYFQAGGGLGLTLEVARQGEEPASVPPEWLFRR